MEIQYTKKKTLGLLKIRTSTSDYLDEGLVYQPVASSLWGHCWRMLLLKILQTQIK